MLPRGFEFNNEDFSLTVKTAPVSLNMTYFQCIVGTSLSRRGYLIVEKRTTSCIGCLPSSSTLPKQEHSSAPTVVKTGTHLVSYLFTYFHLTGVQLANFQSTDNNYANSISDTATLFPTDDHHDNTSSMSCK